MKRVLIAIENDFKFPDKTLEFIEKFKNENPEAEVIEMNQFHRFKKEEIYANVMRCTDIVVQTFLVNGSESQFYQMANLMAKVKEPKNIFMTGATDVNDLHQEITLTINEEQIAKISQHSIHFFDWDLNTYLVNFGEEIATYYKRVSKKAAKALFIEFYKETARQRPTGRKVLVLGCYANGDAFKNLPIGQEVDELECVELQSDKSKARGVWIWGNGEPIMLVNDIAAPEYKIVGKLSTEGVLEEIFKSTYVSPKTFNQTEREGLLRYLETIDFSDLPNLMCEKLGVERRDNREKIRKIIEENLVE